eukprot:gb/GEZN01016340.1/.p1 GENE.gb/GEZN01016340.1/~~gb/GEZN01016340.1/.p1  ORF type:complete len:161 (-),score=15.29 gb/GEZN01016340.1/:184-666(-)
MSLDSESSEGSDGEELFREEIKIKDWTEYYSDKGETKVKADRISTDNLWSAKKDKLELLKIEISDLEDKFHAIVKREKEIIEEKTAREKRRKNKRKRDRQEKEIKKQVKLFDAWLESNDISEDIEEKARKFLKEGRTFNEVILRYNQYITQFNNVQDIGN